MKYLKRFNESQDNKSEIKTLQKELHDLKRKLSQLEVARKPLQSEPKDSIRKKKSDNQLADIQKEIDKLEKKIKSTK